jgi:hypothetical protein
MMRLERVAATPMPGAATRLSGIVRYSDGTTEEYWFTLPSELRISTSGNPWIALLLPLAAFTGEDIGISLPVDPFLLHNAESLLTLWKAWYPAKITKIHIKAEAGRIAERSDEVLSAFTGGVDAFFTVLRHRECKHYINVLGLDMPLRNRAAYDRLFSRLSTVAGELGAKMIPVTTNLRETRWGRIPWETFASGGALAGTFLMLEREFGKILIPSSFDLRTLVPWGTHPLSDPLYSTSTTQIIHDGASHSRVEKSIFLSNNSTALKNLHVCFQGQDTHGQDDTNCCTCSKCYRTMIVLEILGKLKDCDLFDYSKFDVGKIARLDTSSPVARSFFEDIRELAIESNRQDIVKQIDRSFRRSSLVGGLDVLKRTRLLWRIREAVRAYAFRGIATLDRQ